MKSQIDYKKSKIILDVLRSNKLHIIEEKQLILYVYINSFPFYH